jgi:hypothetical protein
MNADDVQLRNVVIDGKDAGQIVVHSQTTIQEVMSVMNLTDISHSGSMDASGNFIFSSKIALTFYSWRKSLDANARVTNDQYVMQIVGENLFHDSVFFAPSMIDGRYYFGFSKSASQFGQKNLACGIDRLINFVNSSIYFVGTTPGIFNLQKSLIYDTKSSIGFIPSGILCDSRSTILDFNVILEFIQHIKFKAGLKLSNDVRERLDMYLNCKCWPDLLLVVPKPVEPVVELVDRDKLIQSMLHIGVEDYGKVIQIVQEEIEIKLDDDNTMDLDVWELSENLCRKLWDEFGEEFELELSVPVRIPQIISCDMEIEIIRTLRSICQMDIEFEFTQFTESRIRKVFRKRGRKEEDDSDEEEEAERLRNMVHFTTNSEIIAILGDSTCRLKKAKTIIKELFQLERVSEDLYDELIVQRCRAPGWDDYMEGMWEKYN